LPITSSTAPRFLYSHISIHHLHPLGTTKIEYYGKPSLGGPFCLVDDRGRGVTDASYQGAFTLIYFGFSHCPDICPSELVKVGRVIKELGIILLR
jgi:protein SCO1/2